MITSYEPRERPGRQAGYLLAKSPTSGPSAGIGDSEARIISAASGGSVKPKPPVSGNADAVEVAVGEAAGSVVEELRAV